MVLSDVPRWGEWVAGLSDSVVFHVKQTSGQPVVPWGWDPAGRRGDSLAWNQTARPLRPGRRGAATTRFT